MYFRCPNCLAASATETGPAGQGLTCSGCGTTYPIDVEDGLGETVKQRYRRIVAYSNEHRIDSPGACSVLIGLMTLEQARRIAAGRIAESAVMGLPGGAEAAPSVTADAPQPASVATGLHSSPTTVPATRRADPAAATTAGPAIRAGGSAATATVDPAVAPLDSAATVSRGAAPRARRSRRSTSTLGGLDIDPAFEPAIRAGFLTVTEAARRGVRQSYAAELTAKHGLSRELASHVADNRTTLKKACEARDRAEERNVAPRRRRTTTAWQKILVVGSATIVLGLVTWNAWTRSQTTLGPRPSGPAVPIQEPGLAVANPDNSAPEQSEAAGGMPAPDSPQERRLATTEVETDGEGRVLRLVGPDPETVLIAYCRALGGPSSTLEPLEITETVPPSKTARLGVFRDLAALETQHSIRIRREWKSRRWVAGTGEHPVDVSPVPTLPEDARRVPVAAR